MILGFQARFENPIREKLKRHTIRAKRKHRPQPGQPCHCYVNPRKKTMRLLGRWYCVRVQDIWIKRIASGDIPGSPAHWRYSVFIDGERLKPSECKRLAVADGFETFDDMMQFWAGRLPFNGDIIHWNPDAPAPAPTKRRAKKK